MNIGFICLVFGPGLIAFAAFGGSIWLFTHRDEQTGERSLLHTLGALFLLCVTLGIGACYAVTCGGSL